MEFHIKGVLDVNGQIQSVQSNCAQTGQMLSLGMPAPLGHCPCQTDGADGSGTKVVNYAVKKDLDRKLHAKVDEMGDLVVELGQTQERLHTYRKLNKEYEEKLERYEHEIRILQDSNIRLIDLLQENDIPVPEIDTKTQTETNTGGLHSPTTRPKVVCGSSCSSHVSSRTSGTSSTTYRKSTTVIDVRHSTISLTDSLYSEAVIQRESTVESGGCAATGDGAASDERVPAVPIRVPVKPCSKPKRPNKLDIQGVNKGCCSENIGKSSTGRDKNKEDGHEICSNNRNSASDLLNNDILKESTSGAAFKDTIEPGCEPQSHETCFTNENGPRNCVILLRGDDTPHESNDGCVYIAPQFPVDSAGYLILMVPTNSTLAQNNGANESSDGNQPDSISEVDVDLRDQCSCSQCHDNNQVHVSWREFHNCRHSSGSQNTPNESGPSRENVPSDEDEIQEPFGETGQNASKNRKREAIYSVIDDSSPEEETIWDSDNEKYTTRAPFPLPRYSWADLPSPTTPSEGSRPKSRLGSSGSSLSLSDTSPDSRRDEDKPDSVMRLMRKTSEWNSTKKAFLEKSVTSTSHDADNTLGAVVMKAIGAFKELLETTQRRRSNNLSDKIIKVVKESLKNKHDDDVITTEFLEKCVQLCEREFL